MAREQREGLVVKRFSIKRHFWPRQSLDQNRVAVKTLNQTVASEFVLYVHQILNHCTPHCLQTSISFLNIANLGFCLPK